MVLNDNTASEKIQKVSLSFGKKKKKKSHLSLNPNQKKYSNTASEKIQKVSLSFGQKKKHICPWTQIKKVFQMFFKRNKYHLLCNFPGLIS